MRTSLTRQQKRKLRKLNKAELSHEAPDTYPQITPNPIEIYEPFKKDNISPEPDILFKPNPIFPDSFITYRELIKAYLDCRKRKSKTYNAVVYEMDVYENLQKLYYELNSGAYTISRSICFLVYEPKPREIFAALFKDRIVHHLFVNRTLSLFEDWVWIQDTYSCRKNKGTLYGVKRLDKQLRDITDNFKKPAWILKLDLTGCFVSVPKDNLFNFISRVLEIIYRGNTKRGIWTEEFAKAKLNFDLWVLYKIVYNKPQVGCVFKTAKACWDCIPDNKSLLKVPLDKHQGMPVGNITSQILVNVFLTILDMFCRFVLAYDGQNGGYGRYVDDAYFVDTDKEHLLKTIGYVIRFVKRHLNMKISKNKIYLQPVQHGVSFTGNYVKPFRIYPIRRNKFNFIKFFYAVNSLRQTIYVKDKLPSYNEIYYMTQCVNSRLGHLIHTDSYKFRKHLLIEQLQQYPNLWSGYFRIHKTTSISYNKIDLNPRFSDTYRYWITN